MIYISLVIQIFIEIFILAWEHKFKLSMPLIFGIGWAIGKRHGIKFAVSYIMKTLGWEKKTTLERKVDWIIEKEKERGNIWNASMLPNEENALTVRLKSLHKVGWLARFAKFIIPQQGIYLLLRRKKKMKKLKSRKFWFAILAVIVPVVNEQFNINLDTTTVVAIIGGLAAYILGESHVDAKRAGGKNEPTPVINTSEFEG